ncbi:GatB/YqeY domain-containing protein [Candidatus Saccharibacteria bacterium]|nr:GatB/YqeY domain-containing protein [Candidatus Saccharibacteria bacterium]
MNNLQQLESDLAEALKERDQVRLTTLRLLKTALKNYQIEVGHDLSPQEMIQVLQKEAKKHRDSIEQYQNANRDDLVKEEQAELDVIDGYLPEAMDDSELEKIVDEVIAQQGATDKAQMGAVIGAVMAKTGGAADGKRVSGLVAKKLN